MTKPQGSATFLSRDERAVLWLGMLSRDAGVRASQLLHVRDEVAALEFDLAVSLRLFTFDNERAKAQARLTAYEVGKLFSGETDESDVLNSSVIHDKYADGNTEIW